MKRSEGYVVNFTEEDVKRIYSQYKKIDESDPFEKLKNTKGWETVATRVEEIIKDYHMKKAAAEEKSR